jgi:LL-diaminopimelate aminotransferase
MSEPFFQKLFAERIGGINYGKSNEIYKFEKIKRAKRQALADFPTRPLIDFGIGENDDVADATVRDSLKHQIDLWENRGYADNGIAEYKEAAARFMKREFNVELDSATEINHCIGSKPALAMIASVFINPGDITLMTVPGYPIAGTHTKYHGGTVYPLPLKKEHGFLPQLDAIPEEVLKKAKLLVLNYPNSPTGTLANESFFASVVAWAKKHEIVVVNDAAHMLLSYGKKPLSFLEIPGARDVGVEIHSMSKGFDMIGWRLGFVAGNPLIVRAFADVKDNTDSGQNIAIQKAGAVALDTPQIPLRIRAKYERRLGKLVDTLKALGFNVSMPGGTYFLYAEAPKGLSNGTVFKNAEEVSQFLIRERSVCTVPWDDAGAYLRFSVTYKAATEQEEDALMLQLKERLKGDTFVW